MKIEMARGDSYLAGFQLREKGSGNPIEESFDEIYFTVKRSYMEKEVKVQKTLTEGGIVSDGDGHYTVTLLPQDTERLPFGNYDFDLEFDRGEFVRTFSGTLALLKETTHADNKR